ncbi:agamous-like MADS-box protein AGL61 [Henckelia pumila]|uniref:agamous-like MADS-box protein AGL61 n=1 Tax=Henckelia pumila TaxID=405737 RepID=UPI003C6DF13B
MNTGERSQIVDVEEANTSTALVTGENQIVAIEEDDTSTELVTEKNQIVAVEEDDTSTELVTEENQIVAVEEDDTSTELVTEENQIVPVEEGDTSAVVAIKTEENQIVALNPSRKRKDRRVGIQLIEERSELNTTFTKRRQGLFKKARHFCEKFDAKVGVVAFSRFGNAFAQGDPMFFSIARRYIADPCSEVAKNGTSEFSLLMGSEMAELTDMEKGIKEALGKGQPAWDMILQNMDFTQLQDMENAVRAAKTKIAALDLQ